MVELEQISVQKGEFHNVKDVRHYVIDIANETVIEVRGITDNKWPICKSLLDELRTTRTQTEWEEVQISPLNYEKVRSLFPKNTSWMKIYRTFEMLNTALAPNGWSIVRQRRATKKPIETPWFLRGPEDGGHQDKGQPERPKQKRTYDRTVTEERNRIALKQFNPLAFGTCLLQQSLASLTNPEAKKIFTKDPAQVMLSLLPTGLKLQDVIGEKTPQEYLQESIQNAINSMAGKTYEELSEKQKPIMPLWNRLKKPGQNPKTAIFQHFQSGPNANESLDETETT